jgi:hypothetical protein
MVLDKSIVGKDPSYTMIHTHLDSNKTGIPRFLTPANPMLNLAVRNLSNPPTKTLVLL